MDNTPPVVWIVDDDPDDQLLLGLGFKKVAPHVQITSLSDGDELLPSLKSSAEPPSLILLDLNMQRQDGFETLAQIRSEATYDELPIVVLTTSNNPDDHKRAMSLGATEFITKPPSSQAITVMLQWLLTKWC